jgi:asparagine synthase (glutamine-hydrolysing)
MCTADGRYWITYNGEIYNHIELRQKLKGLGSSFRSRSDTEVILEAYRHWGAGCLTCFNGMFAFAIVDVKALTVFVARDRFGVKPVYLWRSPLGFLAFASEIKQFSTLPGWAPRLQGQLAYDFLNWGLTDHTDGTLFQDVVQLVGGESLALQLGSVPERLPVRRWYRLEPRQFEGDERAAIQRFSELFEDSVRLRLRSDVPVGSCLSGGLDSSSIACVASALLRHGQPDAYQHAFSARSREARFDEGEYVAAVVAQCRVRAHETWPDVSGLADSLDGIVWHQDEPFASTSIYAQWRVFALAAAHRVRVMLDGQGADESLAGYHGFFGARMAGLMSRLELLELLREAHAIRALHGYSWGRCLAYLVDYSLPSSTSYRLRKLVSRDSVSERDWLNVGALQSRLRDPRIGVRNAVRKLSMSQLTSTNLPMLLHWEDRNSMAHSVESRVPFLDYRLVEFVTGLPEHFLISRGITKRILRESMRERLPDVVRTRVDKIGFATPEETWIRRDSPMGFLQLVERSVDQSRGILLPNAILRAREIVEGRRPFSFYVWRLISFGTWMDRFAVARPT